MRIDSKKLNGPCSCGRNHRMNTKAAVIEPGVPADFERYLSGALPDVSRQVSACAFI